MRWVFSPQQCQCTHFMGLAPWGALGGPVLLVWRKPHLSFPSTLHRLQHSCSTVNRKICAECDHQNVTLPLPLPEWCGPFISDHAPFHVTCYVLYIYVCISLFPQALACLQAGQVTNTGQTLQLSKAIINKHLPSLKLSVSLVCSVIF